VASAVAMMRTSSALGVLLAIQGATTMYPFERVSTGGIDSSIWSQAVITHLDDRQRPAALCLREA